MTSPPTQLPPLPFRLFSYCHMRNWCLKCCWWSLEHPNGDIWYSCTLMNTRCSYRLIDRERYVWYVADTPIIIIIYIKLNINVYICTKTYLVLVVVVVQTLSCVQLFVTPWTVACQDPLSSTVSWSLLKFTSFELVMLFNHLILYCPLFLLPSIFPSIRVFSNESALRITWPKCWSFSFSISPSNEYTMFISFRTDWFDLAVKDFPDDSVVKNLSVNAGDPGNMGSIPGSGRSPGRGNGNLLQFSCLENSMDRGAWRAAVHGVK